MKNQFIYIIIFFSLLISFEYPDFNIVVNNNPYPEDMFIHTTSPLTGSFMAIIGADLELKWHIASIDGKGWDFKVNNNNKLTYFQRPPIGSSDPGLWYVMDSNMQEVDTLSFAGYKADSHDIQYVDNGGYILQAYAKEQIDIPQTTHIDSARILILQEFDVNHNLIFEWKNSDYMNIENYIDSFNLNANYLNWMHGNSIDIDYDNNIIISNRTMSEAIKFDRLTGEIIWILGGPANDFLFINDIHNGFIGQHDIRRLDNGNLLVFDNGVNLFG